MEDLRATRRLAAVMAADIVGFSRMIERDEAATLDAIKTLYRELIDPLLAKFHGRVVKLMGDGALVEFASVVDAVACAVAIQEGAAARQPDVAADRRLVFRIGINLGDVVVDGDDLLGDGVNLAARLEPLCEPGGVLISGTAYDHLQGRFALPLEFAGEQHVKNISRPVRTYRVRMDGSKPVWRIRAKRYLGRKRAPVSAAALVLLAATGGAWWFWPVETANARPAIAVLPFDNYGGDDATGRLADGITEDIVTDLARFRNLDVIARNSTAVYKGQGVDVRQVGRDLNVSYVLEGSIQRQGQNIRATAQLIDARSGAHVWSDRWDRPADDVFAVQTEMSERIAAALGGDLTLGQITRHELQRAKRLRPKDLKAYDYFLLGEEAKAKITETSIKNGIDYLTKAVELDPQLARAYGVRAWLYFFSVGYGADWPTVLGQMAADAGRAVDLDPQDPESLSTLAWAHLMQERYPEAEAAFRSAIEMSPANSHVLILAAGGLATLGLADEGAAAADRALRLDPHMTPANRTAVKDAYYLAKRYEDAIADISEIPEESRTRDAWLFLAGSYAHLGREKDAKDAGQKLMRAYPTVSAERMLNEDYVFPRQEDEDFFIDTFRITDLPVCMVATEIAVLPNPKHLPGCPIFVLNQP